MTEKKSETVDVKDAKDETVATIETGVERELSLVEKLVAVKRAVGGVGKGDRNAQQGFNFRGIDAVLNAVAGPLMKHGIMVYPQLHRMEKGTAATSTGKTMNTVAVTVSYTFTDGNEQIVAIVPGESFDSGDKAVAKAMSVAYRTALIQALSLPTDEPDPDHDIYDAQPEPVAQVTDEQLIKKIDASTTLDEMRDLWTEQKISGRAAAVQKKAGEKVSSLQGGADGA